MNIVGIIQARMGSTRLPGKILKLINDKPLLEYCIARANKSKLMNKLILATSTNAENNDVELFCNKIGTDCFRGSEDDVLGRYYLCAKKYKADIIVRLTGDCPLVDPNIIDKTIQFYLDNEYDYVRNTWFMNSYPSGFDVEVFNFDTLEKYHQMENDMSKREHVVGYMNPEIFKKGYFTDLANDFIESLNFDINMVHLSVDTKEDFDVVSKILLNFKDHCEFGFNDVVCFIDDNIDLTKLNIDEQRKNAILNVKKKIKL